MNKETEKRLRDLARSSIVGGDIRAALEEIDALRARAKNVETITTAGSNCLGDPQFQEMFIRIGANACSLGVEAIVYLDDGREVEIEFGWPRAPRADFSIFSILFQKLGRILAAGGGSHVESPDL